MNEIEVNSKPRRAQGAMGLLSRSIHVQSLHKSMSEIPNSREERRGTGRRGAPGSERGERLLTRQKERERERGARGYLTPTTLNPRD